MYKTESILNLNNESFDWNKFFDSQNIEKYLNQSDFKRIVLELRQHFNEKKANMTFVLGKMLLNIFSNISIVNPNILELGAGIGFLSRFLLNYIGGNSLLVDNCDGAYKRFLDIGTSLNRNLKYHQEDIFNLKLEQKYDIICSFGLIEHFSDKRKILDAHKKYLTDKGYILLLVPLDTILSRVYWIIHPEKNFGYRELLTTDEVKQIVKENGLKLIKYSVSNNYSYDFIAVLCQAE